VLLISTLSLLLSQRTRILTGVDVSETEAPVAAELSRPLLDQPLLAWPDHIDQPLLDLPTSTAEPTTAELTTSGPTAAGPTTANASRSNRRSIRRTDRAANCCQLLHQTYCYRATPRSTLHHGRLYAGQLQLVGSGPAKLCPPLEALLLLDRS
jgi:hypothetical protein